MSYYDNPVQDAALETLAERLRSKMEHCDPTDDGEKEWADLTDRQRELYRICIRSVLTERAALHALLEAEK